MGIDISLQNVYAVFSHFDKLPFNIAAGVGDTMADLKERVPQTVSKCVRKVYNIRAVEIITPEKIPASIVKSGKPFNSVTSMSVTGITLPSLRFRYRGRLLSAVHFSMQPMTASANPVSPYKLTMKVFKTGPRKQIGQHLATHTPNGPYSANSGNILFPTKANTRKHPHAYTHVPMQRTKPGHRPPEAIKKFTTLSMPQMITNPKVEKDIQDTLEGVISKRLNHNLERHIYAA